MSPVATGISSSMHCISLATRLFSVFSPALHIHCIGLPRLIVDRTWSSNRNTLCSEAIRESIGNGGSTPSLHVVGTPSDLVVIFWTRPSPVTVDWYNTGISTITADPTATINRFNQYTGAGVPFVRSSTSPVRRSVGTRAPKSCRQKETSHGLYFKLYLLPYSELF
jgi:hypothetical protein